MNTNIKVIPHSKQRYETCGDWFYDEAGKLQIRVSELLDGRYEQLIAIHELIEATLCDEGGITQDDVDRFDVEFEKNRTKDDVREPGDDPRAPYYRQHQIATHIEQWVASEIGVDWQQYEKEINAL